MVKGKIKSVEKNKSLIKIISLIKKHKSFILEAGAGSGKTWTLIESIKYVIGSYSNSLLKNNQQIVCITYTNVAANEIKDRIDNNSLVIVSTIHDFLWGIIKNYQSELKKEIVEYNKSKSREPVEDLENILKHIKVKYSQYGKNFETGKITHDDVIRISKNIFCKYSKILKIVTDKYPFIFVDEYQDTQPETVDLLLNNLLKNNNKNLVIGFFGDSMQKIYSQGVGKIENDQLEIVTKLENFRCSKKVIELLNKIRPTLKQCATGDNLDGGIVFFHCDTGSNKDDFYKKVIKILKEKHKWDFDSTKTKILMLTHKGIANRLDYPNILNAYSNLSFGRDKLYKRDEPFSELLIDKIEKLLFLYKEKKYGRLINLLGDDGFEINKHADKEYLQTRIEKLIKIRKGKNIEEVMKYIFNTKLLKKSNKIFEFENLIKQNQLLENEKTRKEKIFYNSLMQIQYQEVINLNSYIQNYTPFSTKHGVKGSEYENVLVVIDDTLWSQYSFNDYFGNNKSNQIRFEKTRNLFYVCCSRSKDKLAILSLSGMDDNASNTRNSWFGQKNILQVK